MRRLILVGALALAGCGAERATTVYKPPDLGPPRAEAHDSRAGRTATRYRPLHGNAEHATYYNASGCGVERWAVKTMTDPAANQVALKPQATWVGDLVSIAPPIGPTDRVGPTEAHVFKLSAVLIYLKPESDGDYHLVVEDSAGNAMIVESADPNCASGSLVLPQIEDVRAKIEERFSTLPTGRIEPGIPLTVTGVGFFDRLHGQTGVARNGIELHPLLSIDFLPPAAPGVTLVPPVKLREARHAD